MNSVKIFFICAYATFQIIEATEPEVDAYAQEDVDPYHYAYREKVDPLEAFNTYHAVYGNQVLSDRSSRTYDSEPKSFGSEVKIIMSDNEAIILGTIGAVLGAVASAAVTLDIFNTNSICLTAKALGDTYLTPSSTSTISSYTADPTTATANAVNAQIIAQLNKIENTINGYATPSC